MINKIIYICCCAAYLSGMEELHFSVISCGTTINLYKSSLLEASKKVDVLVVGYNHQALLKNCSYSFNVGRIQYSDRRIVYEKNIDEDNNNYEIYCLLNQNTLYTRDPLDIILINHLFCRQFIVTEPVILSFDSYPHGKNGISYFVEIIDDDDISKTHDCYGSKVLPLAEKHLYTCYEYVLAEALENLGNKKEKGIALSTLSADVGFPRNRAAFIAVKAVLEFIQDNPAQYTHIDFCVSRESDFNYYKEFLSRLKKIYFLFCAFFNDHESLFSLFPRDIINYIGHFLHYIFFS
jgi:hypothetical protein